MQQLSSIDIERYLETRQPETSNLEYKASEALSNTTEVAKDISSMANESGGIIIYGISDSVQLLGIGDLDPSVQLNRIGNIVRDNISGILTIFPYTVDVTDQTIIVVDIPKSYTAPHMMKSSGQFFHRSGTGTGRFDPNIMSETLIAKKYEERINTVSKQKERSKERVLSIWTDNSALDTGYLFSASPVFEQHDVKKLNRNDLIKFFLNGTTHRWNHLWISPDTKTQYHGFYFVGDGGTTGTRMWIDYNGTISFRVEPLGYNKIILTKLSKQLLEFIKFVKFFYSENKFFTPIEFVLNTKGSLNLVCEHSDRRPFEASPSLRNQNAQSEFYFCHDVGRENEMDITHDLIRNFVRWYDQDAERLFLDI